MRIKIRRRVNWNYVGLLLAAVAIGGPQAVLADIVHNDDVIITSSLAVGFDAVNGESFGFDTLRLKENNLRIHFQDTSNSASFPTTDWRIVINDSSNGGGSFFGVEDADTGRRVFKIEANAPSNALYVDDGGRLGLGTATPVVDVHVLNGNTPTVRLEQDGSSGFTPQTWDLAGNETNFFIRDVSNGSKLPFRIRPNVSTSAIDMFSDRIEINGGSADLDTRIEGDDNGNLLYVDASANMVGIGTDTPGHPLHVSNADGSNSALIRTDSLATGESGLWIYKAGVQKWEIFSRSSDDNLNIFSKDLQNAIGGNGSMMFLNGSNGRVGLRNLTPANPFEVGANGDGNGNGAHVTAGGVWTNGSSREFKENIKEVATREARDTVMNLKPVSYTYKAEPGEQYVGFIAEDVPELVATNSRTYLSPMDIVSVVTKVVQDQQQTIEQQQETISTLSERLERLEGQNPAQD